jgi:hypothetical protein
VDADRPFVPGRPERFGKIPARDSAICQSTRTKLIHRGSEHSMRRKAICVIGGSPEPAEATSNAAYRVAAGLGLGEG